MFWRDLLISCLATYINYCGLNVLITGFYNYLKFTKRNGITKNSIHAVSVIILLSIGILLLALPLSYAFIRPNKLAIFIITYEIGLAILLRHFRLDGFSGNFI